MGQAENVVNAERKPDVLAIGIAIASLVLQLGLGIFWIGSLSSTVGELKRRQDAAEAQLASTTKDIASTKTDVAVITSKIDGIAGVVNTMNGKLDARR